MLIGKLGDRQKQVTLNWGDELADQSQTGLSVTVFADFDYCSVLYVISPVDLLMSGSSNLSIASRTITYP